ncbi:MAG: formate dehydrogenase accessory sulfurtransferase FdhD [Candidatus Bathyarchaeota archaeon]|nr:MAG: formate dehydrogenase accessory sulfurtransferase FdhD [Candidatus Bathyarchaeota archaeon]
MTTIVKKIPISKINVIDGIVEKRIEVVAREIALHVFLGSIHFVSILCSPALLKELVIGHLLGEGIIDSADEILNFEVDQENRCYVTFSEINEERHFAVSKPFAQLIVSACGSVGYKSLSELLDTIKLTPLLTWKVEAETVLRCVKQLNTLAETYRKTGGVHVAALFECDGQLVVSAEDVGRHNAVDKVVGAASMEQKNLRNCFLALSGRLTGDIVLKAARVGMPIVMSIAAPLDTGIEVAVKTGVTLIGFARGKKMNIYTNPERVYFRRN